jgi:glutathione S-transferase
MSMGCTPLTELAGIKLFESGAIVEYLIDTYDKDHKLHSADPQTAWLEKSWLYFQVSGQVK